MLTVILLKLQQCLPSTCTSSQVCVEIRIDREEESSTVRCASYTPPDYPSPLTTPAFVQVHGMLAPRSALLSWKLCPDAGAGAGSRAQER